MKQVKADVEHGSISLSSKDIQDMIASSNYIEEVEDMSHRVLDQEVLSYHARLDHVVLKQEVEKDLEEEAVVDDEEYAALFLERAEYFIDAAIDEIKDQIEGKYHIAHMGSAYDIYDDNLQDLHFIMTLSFGNTSHGRLYQVASEVVDQNPRLY